MTQRPKFWGGKFFITAACVATLTASIPNAQINAYSVEYVPTFAESLDISETDEYANHSVVAADGSYVVIGTGANTETGADEVVIAKYSNTGKVIWNQTITNRSDNRYSTAMTSLTNGNYLVSTSVYDTTSSSSSLTFFEVNDNNGSIVKTSNLGYAGGFRFIAEAPAINNLPPLILGVVGDDNTIYAFVKNQEGIYEPNSRYNFTLPESASIYFIREDGDGDFNALGYYNGTPVAMHSDRVHDLYLGTNAFPFDIVSYDGGYIVAGRVGSLPKIWKLDSDYAVTEKYTIEGQSDQYGSYFYSVDVLSDNSIVAVGYSGFDSTDTIDVLGQTDAIIAHLDNNLNPISVRSYGGTGPDCLYNVRADGDAFYVAGTSQSNEIGIEHKSSGYYSVVARFGVGASADVTFHINGDTPDGIVTPENGTYHWDEHSNNDLPTPGSTDDQIFSGWYTDDDFKNKIDGQTPSDDIDLYGKFIDLDHDTLDNEDTFNEWCKIPE